ncbi:type III-B CRISPR module RAMP protein Cmr6 [uncultured Cyclobacterium sp.]|uniref:type III-B CRISPR module RAMP protein Cmr6 n=1 Tax=uncultured Cyclobacterium sp. TaxID=453820 RepID=UPI0030EC73D9
MYTTYPGLLIGSGYQHESGEENEFKLGFFFDYVSGLPLIPGSSVKGMLRSCFPGKNEAPNYDAKLEFIGDVFKENLGLEISSEDIRGLEREIFDGVNVSGTAPEKLSIYKRDKFLDASVSANNSQGITFLGSDYITLHGDPDKGEHLKDPIPLMFLKVLPEIAFSFQFSLRDSEVVEVIKADHKLALFKHLLLSFGIGSKTNVGYGQFTTDVPTQRVNRSASFGIEEKITPKAKHQVQTSRGDQDVIPKEMVGVLTANKSFSGKITKINLEEKTFEVEFEVDKPKTTCTIYKSNFKLGKERSKNLSLLESGLKVTVIIQNDYKELEDLKSTIKIQKP